MSATTLYRFYDVDDKLLYIGVTSVGPSRWSDHEHHRSWWALVSRAAAEHHPDRATALAAEKVAIRAEQPPWNTTFRFPRTKKGEPKRRRHGTGSMIKREDGRVGVHRASRRSSEVDQRQDRGRGCITVGVLRAPFGGSLNPRQGHRDSDGWAGLGWHGSTDV